MDVNNVVSQCIHKMSGDALTSLEESFLGKADQLLDGSIRGMHLSYVLHNFVQSHLRANAYTGLTIRSFSRLLNKIAHASTLSPSIKSKVTKIYLDVYSQQQSLPHSLDTSSVENILKYLLHENPAFLMYARFHTFLDTLTAEQQLELAMKIANTKNHFGGAYFICFSKIIDVPIEKRVQLVKLLIAQAEEEHIEFLCVHLFTGYHLQQASIGDKVELAQAILNKIGVGKDLQAIYSVIWNLHPQEPKEDYCTYLKAMAVALEIAPKSMSRALDAFSQAGLSREEKLRWAKQLAACGAFTAGYLAHLDLVSYDVELATLIAKQSFEACYTIVQNLNRLPLKEANTTDLLGLSAAITQYNWAAHPQNMQEFLSILTSESSLKEENVLELDAYMQNEKIFGCVVEKLFPASVPLSEIKQTLVKKGPEARFGLKALNYLYKDLSEEDMKDFFSLICDADLDQEWLRVFAGQWKAFSLGKVPICWRLFVCHNVLEYKLESCVFIAASLEKILEGMCVADRIHLATALAKADPLAASQVAQQARYLKLDEASLEDRIELAFWILKQGKGSARNLLLNLNYFYLKEMSAEDLRHFLALCIEKEQPLDQISSHDLNIQSLTVQQRFEYSVEMIDRKISQSFSATWLNDMSWSDKIKLAKQVAAKLPEYEDLALRQFPLDQWNFFKVPFQDFYALTEVVMQQGKQTAILFARAMRKYLDVFVDHPDENIRNTRAIILLNLIARNSSDAIRVIFENSDVKSEIKKSIPVLTEFMVDTSVYIKEAFEERYLDKLFPLFSLMSMQTEVVQEELNRSNQLPAEVLEEINRLKLFLQSKEDFKILLNFYEEIETQTRPLLKFKLMRWLAYTACKFYSITDETTIVPQAKPIVIPGMLGVMQNRMVNSASKIVTVNNTVIIAKKEHTDKLKALKQSSILQDIFAHQSIPNRYIFIRELSLMSGSFQERKGIDQQGKPKEFNEYAKLSWILLLKLKSFGVEISQLEKINDIIDRRKQFKATKNFTIFVDLLNELFLIPVLDPADAKAFADKLQAILQLKTMDEVLMNLQCLTNIMVILGRDNFLLALKETDLSGFFFKKFNAHIPLGEIPNFVHKWQNTFASSRYPNAIFIYLRSLERQPQEEREIAKKALVKYIRAVLNGEFPAVRYQTRNQPHLSHIFAKEGVLALWKDPGQPIEVGEYTVSLTENFMDLLLIGTDIQGSCLHIHTQPATNKCLLSYLLHGGVMPVVARYKGNENGKIVARSMLRLGWNKEEKSLVLLQEPVYSNVRNAELSKAIQKKAVEKARQLKIPLIENDKVREGRGELYKGTFSFLGSDYPYIYSDAARGVVDGLKGFDVSNCYVVNT